MMVLDKNGAKVSLEINPVIIWRSFTQYTGGVGFFTSQVPQPLFLGFFNASVGEPD